MELGDLLGLDDVIVPLRVTCKKNLLEQLADIAAGKTGASSREIFEALLQREKLGSTGVGNGIAIPHGKMSKLDKITGIFARLDKPVDFDAMDDGPVDIIFLLLAPDSAGAEHLKALARIARMLREPGFVQKLRSATSREEVYSLLTNLEKSYAA